MSELRHLLADAVAHLHCSDARTEAEWLLAHVLGCSRAWLFAWPQFKPEPAQAAIFQHLVQARVRGEPVAYLTGRRAFWSLDLEVNPAVLIPRTETERLVEIALAHIPPDSARKIADLGTGSGAIALALARERPHAHIVATDASAAALAVARTNAQRLEIAGVSFAQGDWCAALGDACFDMIVSNPPYVAEGDAHLDAGDLRYEPRTALAAGPDGLDAIRRICAQAGHHLHKRGWLLLEHGWQQGTAVRALLHAAGFAEIATEQDLEARERVSLGRAA